MASIFVEVGKKTPKKVWFCHACSMRHAGGLVSRAECTRCGAPRDPTASQHAREVGVLPGSGTAAEVRLSQTVQRQSQISVQSILPVGKPDLANIFEQYPCDEDGYAVAHDPSDADGIR